MDSRVQCPGSYLVPREGYHGPCLCLSRRLHDIQTGVAAALLCGMRIARPHVAREDIKSLFVLE